MIINAYIQANRVIRPTGVGKHVIHATRQLAAIPETTVRIVACRSDHDTVIASSAGWPYPSMPLTLLPGTRPRWEWTWRAISWPALDRVIPRADWIYSPTEVFLPSRRTPVATTVHCIHWFEPDYPSYSSPAYRRARLRWRTILHPMLRHSRLVMAVSVFLKRKLVELFRVPEAKIAVVGNGVEPEFYAPAADLGPPPLPGLRDRYLLSVGGLSMRKGVEPLLAVASRLHDSRNDLQLVIAGPCDPEYVEAARQLPNVLLADYVGIDLMPRLMRGATSLLCLSRHETFGIPVAEAMAAGTPVIASRHAALPEIVGDAGIMVDTASIGEIVDAVRALEQDDRLRQQMIALGRRRAESYRWERCAERIWHAMAEAG